jgi:phosphonate transport system substrate-binding protein
MLKTPASRTIKSLFFLLSGLILLMPLSLPAQAREKLTIGLLPEMNVFTQMQRYRPLADYLGRKLNIDVQLTMLSRYGNIIERLRENRIDAAFLGSFTGALAISQLNVEPLARPINLDGTSTYHGLLFVRKDSGIKNVPDMRNKTIALVERATTAGYIFPLAYFKRNGVEEYDTYLKEYFFAGSHDATIDAVYKKKADIGAAKNTIYDYYMSINPQVAEEIKILARSSPVPSNGLCVLPSVSKKMRTQLRETLLALDAGAEGREVLKKLRAIKFVPTARQDYEPVMDLAEDAGIDLESYSYRNE